MVNAKTIALFAASGVCATSFYGMAARFQADDALTMDSTVGEVCDAMTEAELDVCITRNMCESWADHTLTDELTCNEDTGATFTFGEILGAEDVMNAFADVNERCSGEDTVRRALAAGMFETDPDKRRALKVDDRELFYNYGWCSTQANFILGGSDSANYCDSRHQCGYGALPRATGCGTDLDKCCTTHDLCLQTPDDTMHTGNRDRCATVDCSGARCDQNLYSCARDAGCWPWDTHCWFYKCATMGAMKFAARNGGKNPSGRNTNGVCNYNPPRRGW